MLLNFVLKKKSNKFSVDVLFRGKKQFELFKVNKNSSTKDLNFNLNKEKLVYLLKDSKVSLSNKVLEVFDLNIFLLKNNKKISK